MKKIAVLFTSILLTAAAGAETLTGTGQARYSVRATGHTVNGTVDLKPFEVMLAGTPGEPVLSMEIDAGIMDMTTDNKKRDREMYHVLHAEDHPLIHGSAAAVPVAALKAAPEGEASIPVSFTLAGVTTEKQAQVTAFEETAEGYRMTVRFDVSQLEHFLTPIRKFGFLKVDDTVNVEVDLVLDRSSR